MALEIETKFALEAFAPVREALLRAGARRLSRAFEENWVLDRPDGDLRRRGMLLRLRRDGQGHVTLKLPAQGQAVAGLKIRRELETVVEDVEVLQAVFGQLGFEPALRYEKVRETWELDDTHVCLDRLPFGRYLEIEGAAERIPVVAAQLGLSMETALTLTYHDLYQTHLAACGLPASDSFVFESDMRRDMLDALANGRDLS